MSERGVPGEVGELDPTKTWERLEQSPDTVLIDVRTQAEWSFVGVPDLQGLGKAPVCVEWAVYPNMSVNPRFEVELFERLDGVFPSEMFFICRSGARSMRAALAVAQHLAVSGQNAACFNVAEGFEGDLNRTGHRGNHNGWKARGLAWRQS